ncbi:MAG: hypothetical protein ABIR16_03905 [Dokdonella sp.]
MSSATSASDETAAPFDLHHQSTGPVDVAGPEHAVSNKAHISIPKTIPGQDKLPDAPKALQRNIPRRFGR